MGGLLQDGDRLLPGINMKSVQQFVLLLKIFISYNSSKNNVTYFERVFQLIYFDFFLLVFFSEISALLKGIPHLLPVTFLQNILFLEKILKSFLNLNLQLTSSPNRFYLELVVSGVQQLRHVPEFLLQHVSLVLPLQTVDLPQLFVFLQQAEYLMIFLLYALTHLLVGLLGLSDLHLQHSTLLIVGPQDHRQVRLGLGEPVQLLLLPGQQSPKVPVVFSQILQ